jgi:hypothetical protein
LNEIESEIEWAKGWLRYHIWKKIEERERPWQQLNNPVFPTPQKLQSKMPSVRAPNFPSLAGETNPGHDLNAKLGFRWARVGQFSSPLRHEPVIGC